MLAQAGVEGFLRAAFSGGIFVLSFSNLFGGLKITGNRLFDILLWLIVAVLAILPGIWTSCVALAITVGLYVMRRQRKARKLAAIA